MRPTNHDREELHIVRRRTPLLTSLRVYAACLPRLPWPGASRLIRNAGTVVALNQSFADKEISYASLRGEGELSCASKRSKDAQQRACLHSVPRLSDTVFADRIRP